MTELKRERNARPADRMLIILQSVFVGSIVFSLAGSLFLRVFPEAIQVFGPYYPTLVKGPTWTYMAFLPVIAAMMYWRQLGGRKLLLLIAIGTVIGGLSEILGTTTGYPFGVYAYTEWLGPKIAGHVPLFIPFSWFAMSLVTFDLAGRIAESSAGRVFLAVAFMVLWDVSLDPAMSKAFPFWYYPGGGIFYGMPLVNWFGWALVSLVIMTGYTFVLGNTRIYHKNAGLFFGLNCAFPLLLSLIYGLEGAFLVGVIATSVPFVLQRIRKKELALSGAG